MAPTPVIPSPKSHAYVSGSPSGSDEPVPSKVTGAPTIDEYGPSGFAVGQRFPAVVMVRIVVALAVALAAPLPSLTVHTMLNVPASPGPGVPEMVAVRGDGPGTWLMKIKSAGFPVCVIVRLFAASGSVAVAMIGVIGLPATSIAVAGA